MHSKKGTDNKDDTNGVQREEIKIEVKECSGGKQSTAASKSVEMKTSSNEIAINTDPDPHNETIATQPVMNGKWEEPDLLDSSLSFEKEIMAALEQSESERDSFTTARSSDNFLTVRNTY